MPFLPKYMGKTKTTLIYPPSLQFKFLSILILIFLESSLATDTLTVSHALSARETLISSGNRFELGFFSPGSSRNLYVGIWFTNVPWRRPVWVANRENQLLKSDANSTLEIGLDGNLRVLNGAKNTIWSTNVTSSRKNGTIAVLSEKGNLILKDNVSESTLWQSFDHPCDTFIAGMKMGKYETTGEKLFYTSWKTEDDPSLGDYVLGLTTEKPTQNFVWKTSNKGLEPHWRSGPWDGWTFIGLRGTYGGYSNGLVLDQDNQQGTVYGTYLPPSLSEVMIEVVTPDGNINVTRYDTKNPGVVDTRLAIAFPCEAYNFCGSFGFCDGKKATCECLEGFVPKSEYEWKQGNWTLGCVRRSVLPCRSNGGNLTYVKKDVFAKMKLMKPPDYHVYMVSNDLLGCEKDCSNNCSCEAYAYVNGIGCLIWFRDLVDIERFESGGIDLYLRLAHFESGEANKTIKLVIILTTLFGVILLVIFTYCMFRCIVNRRATRQQEVTAQERIFHGTQSRRLVEEIRGNHNNQNESLDLPMYTFSVLSAATNNFGEENKLGAGGFGPVYKGKLEDGQEIAVKRLSEHSGQGIAEFKNEIILISKLKHRNLVTLLGYCIKGDEKLLVYEYLKNKSLDDILFEKKSEAQFDWAKRSDIIQGIARGILYLHRDSHLRVIHRDLKASNILLDDQMNPKISDFGLARGFLITQELANTHRVVGTLGYMSPEYALGGLFSEKSDVYSFGVLLLEIISGMKNTSVYDEEKYLNLLGYAWHLWEEGRGLDLMDKQLLDTCLSSEFIKYMQIGLLCVQDHGIDRPTMSLVVLMLTSDMDISQPKRPTFFQGLLNSDLRSQSSTVASKNYMSLSIVEGR